MKHKLFGIVFLFTTHLTFNQVIHLIDEKFSEGIPTNWIHCSGNWGSIPQWSTVDSILKESSGPYFGRVLNGIQLPAVDLNSLSNPVLEFDLDMIDLKSDVQFSIYYSTDSVCETEWDNDASFYKFSKKKILTSFSPEKDTLENRRISIDLSTLGNEQKIFFTLTADYMNYFADGVWQLDNLQINGNIILNTEVELDDIALQIYPNPVNSTLNISRVSNSFNYNILNTIGSTVLTGSGTNIDVSNLPNGLYFLISGKQNLKFIKE